MQAELQLAPQAVLGKPRALLLLEDRLRLQVISRIAGDRSANRWSVAALALALCASLALLVLPIYTQGHESSRTDAAGHITRSSASSSETLLNARGFGWIAILLAVPIVITAAPVLLKRHPRIRALRTVAAFMLLPILPVGYFTIGGFYLPSAVAMFIAATRRDARADECG